MNFTSVEVTTWVASLFWPFVRISAMFVAVPIFSARSVPVGIRVLLAVLIAWVLLPVIPAPPAVDMLSGEAMLITIYQVFIGVGMGFIFQMVFAAFIIAGHGIAMTMGLGFASIIDPQNGVQVPVVSQGLLILSTLVFLTLNGHLLFIEVIAQSFYDLPVGLFVLSLDGLWQLVMWGSTMFAGGVLIALPAVTALLLVNIAFGVTAKAAPQLNIFAVGFPVMNLVGLIFIIFLLPSMTSQVTGLTMQSLALVQALMN